jgi:hypothetical protein
MKFYVQLLIFFSCLCITLIGIIDKSNEIIELRALIPRLESEYKEAQEDLVRLRYELYQMENRVRLMELLKQPEFGHLIFPSEDEVEVICGNAG